ncbi:hypothetical protein NDQ57_10535 [Rossellomorea marisflavi]|nr:hypothetical protein [Rossellomorea marisflavi]MCM2605127.1 hypothetical protein [Rossellomorea marisflavi]
MQTVQCSGGYPTQLDRTPHGKRVAAAERNGLLSHPFSSFLSDSTHR